MNGILTGQIGIDLVRDEWRDRRNQLRDANQNFVGRGVNALLILRQFFCVESAARAADIPVGQIFRHKVCDGSDGSHVIILIHVFCHIVNQLIVFAEDPAIQLRSLRVIDRKASWIDIVLIRVKHEEIIYIS